MTWGVPQGVPSFVRMGEDSTLDHHTRAAVRLTRAERVVWCGVILYFLLKNYLIIK